MIKPLRIVLWLLPTWLLWLFVSQHLFCARFQFNEPSPFEGSRLYNPYDSISTSGWRKCNFHAHSKAWNGATNGHGTASDVHNAYRDLQYRVHCVSNYHSIDTTGSYSRSYIPAYEHGYNIRKTHQLVLGSNKVQWLDYIFPQSLHNKQHVLQQLYDPNAVVILNHPGLRNGYETDDFSSLSGYQCMEVLNPSIISTNEWDAALSAGKTAFIVGNDDIHNVLTKERLGTMCTFVNVPDDHGKNVLNALKTGKSYGVALGKTQAVDSVPFLSDMRVQNDTITIKMSASAAEITLTGQNGRELASFKNADLVQYKIKPDDHYVRATFAYENGTTVYLNPVFYTSESGPTDTPIYENVNETTFFRTLGAVILFLWLLVLWRFVAPKSGHRLTGRRLSLR